MIKKYLTPSLTHFITVLIFLFTVTSCNYDDEIENPDKVENPTKPEPEKPPKPEKPPQPPKPEKPPQPPKPEKPPQPPKPEKPPQPPKPPKPPQPPKPPKPPQPPKPPKPEKPPVNEPAPKPPVQDGAYLRGDVLVPVSENKMRPVTLHFHNGGNQNRGGRGSFNQSRDMLVSIFQQMVDRGMHPSQVEKFVDGVRLAGNRRSGVYIKDGGNICGYSGAPRTIACGSSTSDVTKGLFIHELGHGWEWETFEYDNTKSIQFTDLFIRFANLVYHARKNNPNGPVARLPYLDYGLQNEAEWGSEVIKGWVFDGAANASISSRVWNFIKAASPEFVQYFDCIFKDGKKADVCTVQAFGVSQLVTHQQTNPALAVPTVAGFSHADSQAIWKVCTNAADKRLYTARFDSIIKRVAPRLPGSPARHYGMGYGDCNHDGTVDWVCWYNGPGPSGVGNGRYLWNRDNKQGAYTFIASGKRSDSFARYIQDPFYTMRTMTGIAQPKFREWQSDYGSCNGARMFNDHNRNWKREYLKDSPVKP